ncbi:P-type ATPase related protein [Cyclospora cayetanensis]|uniref:P-type ATPase related protein n=1 Tax=Cyclospora cayetanensis TaxID=88456 RepID=A0A1D3D6L2_9EIME|nr:P-type ATPase related protein [Cyclospora cayetanensis]
MVANISLPQAPNCRVDCLCVPTCCFAPSHDLSLRAFPPLRLLDRAAGMRRFFSRKGKTSACCSYSVSPPPSSASRSPPHAACCCCTTPVRRLFFLPLLWLLQGQLLRTLIVTTSPPRASSKEGWTFLALLVLLALFCCVYVALTAPLSPFSFYHTELPSVLQWLQPDVEHLQQLRAENKRSPNTWRLLLTLSHIVTSVVPPEFPMLLSLTLSVGVLHLARVGICCTDTLKLAAAGGVRVTAFDKTGTLTHHSYKLLGVFGVGRNPEDLDSQTPRQRQASILSQQVGRRGSRLRGCRCFSASRSLPACSAQLKGAPERLKGFLAKVPAFYDAMADALTSRVCSMHHAYLPCSLLEDQSGLRVLAIGARVCFANPQGASRDALERDLLFCGFLTFAAPVKPGVHHELQLLRKSGHQVIMLTGDHALTAAAVAADGRCCLASLLLMHRLTALNCAVTAFSLSVLSMDGVRLSDTQAALDGLLSVILSCLVSATPEEEQTQALETESAEQRQHLQEQEQPVFMGNKPPPKSVLTFWGTLSLVAQGCLHVLCLSRAWALARTFKDSKDPSNLTRGSSRSSMKGELLLDADEPFEPDEVNTAVGAASLSEKNLRPLAEHTATPPQQHRQLQDKKEN